MVQNLAQTGRMLQSKENTKQVPKSDYKFIGGHGKLLQLSVIHGQIVKDYGRILNSWIKSMVTTSDKKWLFVLDAGGHYKQVNIKQ